MATKKKENNENTKVSGKKAEASAVNNAEAEAAREKFQEKLKELLSLAKKKKNMLEYQEISDFFADMQLDSDKFEKILEDIRKNVESLVFMELPGVKLELNVSGVCRPGKVDELLDQVRI